MCLAIPLRVVAMEGTLAVCEGRNGGERVDTLLTGPLEPGTWVLSFLGSAREIIDANHAARIDAALDGLTALLSGQADAHAIVDAQFADLVGREPQLPEFLRPTIGECMP